MLTLELCDSKIKGFPRLFEILYCKEGNKQVISGVQPIFIQIPLPFPYKSTKVVPWDYNVATHVNGSRENLVKDPVETVETNVTNVSEASEMTRSGRVFASEFSMKFTLIKSYL